MKAVVVKNPYKLVIIDASEQAKQEVIQSDGNAYEQDTKLLIPAQQLGKVLSITIILIHHTRKFRDTENPFNNTISGSLYRISSVDKICERSDFSHSSLGKGAKNLG